MYLKCSGRVWARFIWLRIETCCERGSIYRGCMKDGELLTVERMLACIHLNIHCDDLEDCFIKYNTSGIDS